MQKRRSIQKRETPMFGFGSGTFSFIVGARPPRSEFAHIDRGARFGMSWLGDPFEVMFRLEGELFQFVR